MELYIYGAQLLIYVIYMCSAILFVKQRWLLGIFSITIYLHIIDCVTKYAFFMNMVFFLNVKHILWLGTHCNWYLFGLEVMLGRSSRSPINERIARWRIWSKTVYFVVVVFLWIFFIIHWISKFQYVSLFCIRRNRGVGWTKYNRLFLFVVEYLTLTNIPF